MELEKPRQISTLKPAHLVLVGGFLGAGKTTALQALAQSLTTSGLAVGFVTNDQTTDLVDTRTLGRLQLPIAEVAGGCFCCRFDDLIASAERVMETGPDVLLCEPVGSCTDMAATVLAPLRRYYPKTFSLAPFTVLVDPDRIEEMASLPESVRYIFEKQLEEADTILLSKSDTLTEAEIGALKERLSARWDKPVLPLSGLRGDGIEQWRTLLLEETSSIRSLGEIDYDLYAEGEAVLGWLNATAQVTGLPTFAAKPFLSEVMARLQVACQREEASIAHLKASLSSGETWLRANLIQSNGLVALEASGPDTLQEAILVVNARIGIDPEHLRVLVEEAIAQVAHAAGAQTELLTMQSFRPGYPTPPYRISAG